MQAPSVPSPAIAETSPLLELFEARRESVRVRRLTAGENGELLGHLQRLDTETRRARFGHLVGEAFLETYAAQPITESCVIEGLFVNGVLRGVGELRIDRGDREAAEAAFSIETLFQGRGFGGRLFDRMINSARNRGVRRIVITCARDNRRIVALARRHGARLTVDGADIVAELPARPADLRSLRAEWLREAEAIAGWATDWRISQWKRAMTPFYGALGLGRALRQMVLPRPFDR
ncbi:GNAT family N-acetyltransferase [Fulvimarina endophytica]|uniref:GNAT family N-acetyltransferase n=1 Tax=Fulvimarina endophytica TaxID=2293836 RepID=A0A371X799_9HYPH|nr:GNAT family N-acetyltransferase [Fulvimarina endophytica]RFC65088.1 GNAT family N-acetyltransferase [Fulvimarina endophytica]